MAEHILPQMLNPWLEQALTVPYLWFEVKQLFSGALSMLIMKNLQPCSGISPICQCQLALFKPHH